MLRTHIKSEIHYLHTAKLLEYLFSIRILEYYSVQPYKYSERFCYHGLQFSAIEKHTPVAEYCSRR